MSYFSSFAGVLLFWTALLGGKCSLAYSGFGALVIRSNPLTHTNPTKP